MSLYLNYHIINMYRTTIQVNKKNISSISEVPFQFSTSSFLPKGNHYSDLWQYIEIFEFYINKMIYCTLFAPVLSFSCLWCTSVIVACNLFVFITSVVYCMAIAHVSSATIASYLGNFLVNFIMNNATVIIFVCVLLFMCIWT